MKKINYIILSIFLVFSITACGSSRVKNTRSSNSTKSVEDVLAENSKNTENDSDTKTEQNNDKKDKSSKKENNLGENYTYQKDEIDIDLTTMSSDMVYASIYQMMTEPSSFEGNVIKMKGNYAANWYEPTNSYIHCVIIQDATACCAQGMEFVWGDGNHKYPDDYPKIDEEITVIGVFETYKDEGDENLYCHLIKSSLEE